MNKIYAIIAVLAAAVYLTDTARGASTVTMPMSYDSETLKEVTVLESTTLTYDGYWAEAEMLAPVGVHFVPANAGDVVKVTFTQVYSFEGTNAELKAYNGSVVLSGYSLPAGSLGDASEGKTYQSTASDGSLTVAFYNPDDDYVKYTATVECVSNADMAIQSVSAAATGTTACVVGATGQAVMAVDVQTEGAGSPLSVTSVAFSLAQSADYSHLSNLKVYGTGDASTFTLSDASLFGAAQQTGSEVRATGSAQLSAGHNYFWLVGDVGVSATTGEAVQAQCTSLKVGDTEYVSTAVTGEALTVGNELLMTKSGKYYVGDTTLMFYDDGGKDGKISSKFDGTVTFAPTTAGKVVQIKFTDVALYESAYGSDTYDDKLWVYNGATASADNLNAQVKKGDQVTLRSSSEDGTLTIRLVSVTGDYYRGAGFTAEVSEYVPAEMTVSGVTAEQVSDATSCAGDADRAILKVTVETENTQAVSATKFVFNTTGTTDASHLSKATLYYTGKSTEFSTAKKVGESVPTSLETFTIEGEQTLVEGANNFWLAYDIDIKAETGEIIDAGCESVTVGGTDYVPGKSNPDGNSSIENTLISSLGKTTKTVYGEWTFKSQDNPYTGSSYKAESGEQVTTFVPGTEGRIIELDITSFALYYASSSYYPQARFEVYSGQDTGGAKLWSLTSTDDKDSGPGKVLRSTSADGALTVVFDAKTTSSSYTSKGFTAKVRQYESRPMTVKTISATQASTEILNKGAKNEEILCVNIATEGNLSAVVLKGLTFDLKGSASAVDKAYVYSTGSSKVIDKTTAVGTLAISDEMTEAAVTLNRAIELMEGDNYFWLTFDISEDAATDTEVDASVKSAVTYNETLSVSDGDPEGSRAIKNVYMLKEGDNGEIVVGDEALMFYDAGGKDGKTTTGFEGYVTFVPKETGKAVKLTFNSFDLSYNDTFTVDNGGEKKTTSDYKFSTYSKPEASIVSVSDDGKFTVYYKCPTYSTASAGWECEAVQYELQPLSVASVTTMAVAPASTIRGAKDVAVVRVDVETAGDKGSVKISKFAVTTEGSSDDAVSGATVYVTDGTTFSTTNKLGTAREFPLEISTDYDITAPGTYRFWVAYDINAATAAGGTAAATVTSVTADGAEVRPAEMVTATMTVTAGKSGVYTVGEGGDFATIQAAVDAVATGIEGSVTISIKAGEYKETVTIPEIPGASDVNPVTIMSESGDYNDVKIYYDDYISPAYGADGHGVVTFDGADFVTLKNVTVTTTNSQFPAIVYGINHSTDDTVDSCHIYTDRNTSTTTATQIYLVRLLADDEADQNNDRFTLQNSLLEGGYRGAGLGGTSYTALPKQKGVTVKGNTFKDQGVCALQSYSKDEDMTISGNVFENSTTDKSGFNMLDLQLGEGALIEGNSIRLNLKVTALGLYCRKLTGTAEKPVRIINNEFIVDCSGTSSAALKINGTSAYIDIANNSVLVKGNAQNIGFWYNDAMSNLTVRNNIIQAQEGSMVMRTYKTTVLDGATLSNNVLYTTGSTFAKTSSSSTSATYSDWVTAFGETAGYNESVTFLSDNMLFPAEAGNLVNAVPLDYVKTDIQGTARSATPTIGAYEYADASAVPAYEDGYPMISNVAHTSAKAVLKATANGSAYLLVKKSADPAPSVEEVKASTLKQTLRASKEVSADLTGLEIQTTYTLYSVLESLDATAASDVLSSETFTTTYQPTEVSTFEDVTIKGDGSFVDGTAEFSGFTVVESADAVVEGSKKVAKLDGVSALQLTNTTQGLTLTGFFIKTDGEVALNLYDAEANATAYTIQPTQGWIFYNLKDKGKITAADFATEGNAYIDDFSGAPLALTMATVNDYLTVDAGEKAGLAVTLTGGVSPISVTWVDAMEQETATGIATESPALDRSAAFTARAVDAWGNTATAHLAVAVRGEQYAATFDDNLLAEESYYNGFGKDDSDWTSPGVDSKFASGSFIFDTNRHTSTWWNGFGMSNQTSTVFADYGDQYHSAVGGGHKSANYGVAYSYTGASYAITVANAEDGDEVSGFYVTNTANNVNAYVNGDGMSTQSGGFVQGDYFKMVINAEFADGSTQTLDYYLADYRSENSADWYYLDTWQWVDLRSLGSVKKFTFGFEGTKTNQYGLTTPTYFCLDDFGGEREIVDASTVVAGTMIPANVDLSTVFSIEQDGSSVAYAITDEADGEVADVTLVDGVLTVKGVKDKSSTDVIVSCTQKGKISFARVPIEIDQQKASVDNVDVDFGVSVYPNPATDRLNIRTSLEGYTADIYTSGGRLVLRQSENDGNAVIPVSHLAQGVYFLNIWNAGTNITKKIVIK